MAIPLRLPPSLKNVVQSEFGNRWEGSTVQIFAFFSHDPPPQGEKLERRCEFLDELKRLE